MSVDLNHIIVYVRDKWASAEFLAGILGLMTGSLWAHFVPVRTANGHVLELITRPYGDVPEQWINGVAVKAAR